MAEPVVQTRTISGRGIFRLDERFEDCRLITLYSSVLRQPKNRYLNKNWSPDQGQYANLTFCYQDYVALSYMQKYEMQSWVIHDNESAQIAASLVCMYDGILETFVNLANALDVILSPFQNKIRDHPHTSFQYDELRFDCYADTALTLTVIGEKITKCNPLDAPGRPPQLPPPRPPSEPPGTPLNDDSTPLSPPYEEEDSDKESPFPGDLPAPPEEPDFPAGEECVPILMRWLTGDSEGNEQYISRTVFGVVEGQRIAGDQGNYSIFVTCQGDATTGCIPVQELQLFTFNGVYIEFIEAIPPI